MYLQIGTVLVLKDLLARGDARDAACFCILGWGGLVFAPLVNRVAVVPNLWHDG